MDLQKIKLFCENREGGVKKLASDIGMSEANLHRCIRNNQIQAGDLECIAYHLNVDISEFFDTKPSSVTTGDYSNVTLHSADEVHQTILVDNNRETGHLRARLEAAESLVEALRAQLSEKDQTAAVLRQLVEEKQKLINLLEAR